MIPFRMPDPAGGALVPAFGRHLKAAALRALAQARPMAALAGAAGAAVLVVFLALMEPGPGAPSAVLMLALFLFFLALHAFTLLTAGNCAVEVLLPGGRGGRCADGFKALLLVPLAALWVVSALKFTRTLAPLRVSDLRFLALNAGQIVREGTATEAFLWGGFAAAVLGGAGVLGWWLVRCRRRAAPALTGRSFVLMGALGIAGLAAMPASRPFLLEPLEAWPQTPALLFRSYAWYAGARLAPALGRVPLDGAVGEPFSLYRPGREADRLNAVLVMLEAVPWHAAGFNGGRAGVTPRLDALARESVAFARPYATSSQSQYAQMAVLSSLFPHKFEGHDDYRDLAYPRALLWDALRPAGYATALFSCQNEEWGNMIRYLRTPGLEVFRHCRDWPQAPRRDKDSGTKVWEETVVGAWDEWMRGLDRRPFFAYLNFQATHFPYELPPGAPGPFAPSAIDFPCTYAGYPRSKLPVMRNRFDNALHYSDAWVGEVVDRLKAAGEWDRTVLLVVSDHGEAFHERGRVCHGSDLHEEQVRTLLLFRAPGLAPRRVEEPVSHLDAAPALLDLLGLPPHPNFQGRGDILDPGYTAAGRPLLFTLQGIVAWDGMLLDGWKYLVHWDVAAEHLYDLASDPGERDNRAARSPRTRALDGKLRRLLETQVTYYEERLWERGSYPRPLP